MGYLDVVRQEACLICGGASGDSDAHHLKFMGGRGMGKKADDKWAAPLCRIHHSELHRFGREVEFWTKHSVNVVEWCEKSWKGYRDGAEN